MAFSRQLDLLLLLPLFSGLLLTVMFLVGFLSGFSDPLFLPLFYLHLVSLLVACGVSFFSFFQLVRESRWQVPLVLFSFLFFFGLSIVLGLLPAVSRDALIHHLAVPKWWIESGGVRQIPWHEWSYYPMLLQLGFVGLLKLGFEQFLALYHALFLWITAGIVALTICQRFKDTRLAVVSYVLLLSLPICFRLTTEPLVDLGLVLFCGVAVVLVMQWSEGERPLAGCIGVGVALGLAASTKYNGLLFAFFFLLLILILGSRAKKGFLSSLFFAGGAATLCFLILLPWLSKNFIWTGNPIFPLFRSLFETVESVPGGSGLSSPLKRFGLYGESYLDYLLTPFRMIFFGEDDSPRWFDGVLSPFLALGFFAVLNMRKSRWRLFLFLLTVSYVYGGLFLSGPRIRYLLPVLVPWTLLALSGLREVGSFGSEKQRSHIYSILIGLHLLFAGLYVVELADRRKAIPYYSGALPIDDYRAAFVPEYRLAQFANDRLKDQGTVYLLYTGNRFSVYDVPVISGGYFPARLLLQWLDRSNSAEEFARDLKNRGVRFLLAHRPLTVRALNEVFRREPAELASRWQEFQDQYLELLQQDGSYVLYRIKDPRENESDVS